MATAKHTTNWATRAFATHVLTCDRCKTMFRRAPSRRRSGKDYCSRDCSDKRGQK